MSDTTNINEAELEQVTGGSNTELSKCFFTPRNTGKKSWTIGGEMTYWLECASKCTGCTCHGQNWCRDKWHQIDSNDELYPAVAANHVRKPKSNKYNTKDNK